MDRELITTFAVAQAAREIEDRLDQPRGRRRPTPFKPVRRHGDSRKL